MTKKRVLITGASGLLGNNLATYWAPTHEVMGIYNAHKVHIDGVDLKQADLLDLKALEATFKDFAPEVIIHCAAFVDMDACELDPLRAHEQNVTATRNVAAVAGSLKAKLVHISTDAVYDGTIGNYKETDPVRTVNVYGKTKAEAEIEALKAPGALIARTSIYGFNIQDKRCFPECIPGLLASGKTITGFVDVMTSSIYTMDLAVLLDQALTRNLEGIYNVGCSNAVSKFEFVQILAREAGLDQTLIKKISVADYQFKATRGKDLSMDVSKLSLALGSAAPSMGASIAHFVRDFKLRGRV